MQIIKPILIVCFVILLIVVFRQRGRAGLRAGSRIAALLLGLAAVVFVIDPGIPQALAELVGVVRGTDLILYILVVVFAITSVSLYFGQRAAQVQIQQIARRVALADAVAAKGPPGAPDEAGAPGVAMGVTGSSTPADQGPDSKEQVAPAEPSAP